MGYIKKTKEENPYVHYIIDNNVFVGKKDFEWLTDLAFNSVRQRARYCAHENKESKLHEMFDVFTEKTYLHPLKQIHKMYSFHVIAGSADVYLFSDEGKVTEIISIGDFQSGKPFYFRAPINTYRTLVTTSPCFIYHEVTTGPFVLGDTIFAPWAPKEGEIEAIQHFLSGLKNHKCSLA